MKVVHLKSAGGFTTLCGRGLPLKNVTEDATKVTCKYCLRLKAAMR